MNRSAVAFFAVDSLHGPSGEGPSVSIPGPASFARRYVSFARKDGAVNAAVVAARAATKDKRYADSEALMLKVTSSRPELVIPVDGAWPGAAWPQKV